MNAELLNKTVPAKATDKAKTPDTSTNENNDVARWSAVVTRDKSQNGRFIFAVTTTGIYCRPSCPARTAKRENDRFFANAAEAQDAGFRACKRCKPDGDNLDSEHQTRVQQACLRMDQSSETLPLAELAEEAGLSAQHFHRVFKTVTGLTPKAYQQAVLNRRLLHALDKPQSITTAIYAAGFNSPGRFYASADAVLGMSAKQRRDQGAQLKIGYAIADTRLGKLLIAATERGVCSIEFDDDAQPLLARLQARFAKATLVAADESLQLWLAQLLDHLDQPRALLTMPLDIQGTVFQQRVWQALRKIPLGQTMSYAELATQIGQPNAVRAVASACAANEIAVLIPCHRVVRGDGSLSGYRWGVTRKAALLKLEKLK